MNKETCPATLAERQARWRDARDGIEQRVEVWLPTETAAALKNIADSKGVSLKAIAAGYIERGLARTRRYEGKL